MGQGMGLQQRGRQRQFAEASWWMLGLLLWWMTPLWGAADAITLTTLSAQERQWLAAHPNIRVGVMDAWEPLNFVDSSGVHQGIGADYLLALNQRLDGALEIVTGPWQQIYDATVAGELDLLMDVTPKPARELFFHFTSPYLDIPHVIVARKDSPYLANEIALSGMTLALEEGFGNVAYFREHYPDVVIQQYRDTAHALDAVARGEAAAYAGNRTVALYLMAKEVIPNLKVHGRLNKSGSILAFGARKGAPELRDIIQKALDDISMPQQHAIVARWIGQEGTLAELTVPLSQEERQFLDGLVPLRLGLDQEWPPVEFLDPQGQHQGISADYLALISQILGVELAPPQRMGWDAVLQQAGSGTLDLLPALMDIPERRSYLSFTQPYLEFPMVVFVQDRVPLTLTGPGDLYGQRVAVVDSYSIHGFLRRDYPELDLVPVASVLEGLTQLSVGAVDAFVGNLTVGAYLINQHGLGNLKVGAPTEYRVTLSMGVSKQLEPLVPLLDRALEAISPQQRSAIRKRWLAVAYEDGVSQQTLLRWGSGIALVVLLVFGTILLRNRRLQHEVEKRLIAERALARSVDALVEVNDQLKQLDQLKSMFIASISHELRTPLNSIIGFSGMMVSGAFGALTPKYQDYTQRIHASGRHLLALTTDIIDISKIESGRIDRVITRFEVRGVVDELASAMAPQLQEKGLHLEVEGVGDSEMITDRTRLLQSLLNIVSNSVKYSERGTISLRVFSEEHWMRFDIYDEGIGIAAEDMGRLFIAFERMESHLRVKAGGTGLGLYLTRKIVTELLQGTIGAESTLGQGSHFWLRIPRCATEPQVGALSPERDRLIVQKTGDTDE